MSIKKVHAVRDEHGNLRLPQKVEPVTAYEFEGRLFESEAAAREAKINSDNLIAFEESTEELQDVAQLLFQEIDSEHGYSREKLERTQKQAEEFVGVMFGIHYCIPSKNRDRFIKALVECEKYYHLPRKSLTL